jgi:L-fuconolactonase
VRPAVLTIDAQLNAHPRNHPGRPWAGVLIGPEEATCDQPLVVLDANRVDGAILVSVFTMYRHDPSCSIDFWREHFGRFVPVKPVDPSALAITNIVT